MTVKSTSQLRLLQLVLSRFSKATGILTTLPIVQRIQSAGTVLITVGYVPLGLNLGKVSGAVSANMVNALADYLSRVFGAKVVLRLIRVGSPTADANVLAQYLGSLLGGSSQASHKFKTVMLRLAKYSAFASSRFNSSPLGLQGLRVRVSGRLTTEPTRPRQTVQLFSLGSFSSNKIQAASFTATNAKGSVTIKVWIGLSSLPSPHPR